MRFSILLSACGALSWSAQVSALPRVRNYAQEIQTADDVAGAASLYAHSFIDSGKNPKPQKKTKRQVITQRDLGTNTLLVRPFLKDTANGFVVIPGNKLETPTPTKPQLTATSTLTPIPQVSTAKSSTPLSVVPDVTSQLTAATTQTTVPQISTTVSSSTLPVVPDVTSQLTAATTQTTAPQISTTVSSSTLPVVPDVTSQFTYSSPTLPVVPNVTSQFTVAITQTPVPQNSTAGFSPTLPVVPDVTSQLTVTLTRTVVTQVCNEESSPTLPVVPDVTTQSGTPTTSSSSDFLRGVNLGGWLVLEKWMNLDAFTGDFSAATDEWSFSQISGAGDAIKEHWETFFTEADIKAIASTGINALRIPIGFWAYDNENTPYIKGADVYLERAIGWARNAGMKVWIDCHGSPGSQNGFDNSGHAGDVKWQVPANLERSILVLKTLAAKYGTLKYADVVVGLQLINEPISFGANELSVTKSWSKNAYHAVKSVTTNPDVMIVMHDAFEGALAWADVAETLNDKHFAMDTHMYHDADANLTQAQHIAKVCSGSADLAAANAVMPTFVGEWSGATDICVNPDGTTTPGTSCSATGCQCQSADSAAWNGLIIEQVRRFVEAQLDVFEASASGYFMWSAKAPGGWGFLNGIANGAIPNPVTSRNYPGQCGGQ